MGASFQGVFGCEFWRSASVALLAGLLLSGCDSVGAVPAGPSDATASVLLAGSPRLQGGDRIRVIVFGEDKLTGDYDIDPGGFVSLPLAGTLQAAGLTKAELEKLLTQKFHSSYLRDPKVTVDIASFRPFYVLGEVLKPGEYPYKSGLTVLSAIAVAGGQTYRASNSTILIKRAGDTQLKSYDMSADVPIYPGDLIRLPQRYF
jgi:polysaccharide export outer membrane protein